MEQESALRLQRMQEEWFNFTSDSEEAQLMGAHRIAANVVARQTAYLDGVAALSDADLQKLLDTVSENPETGPRYVAALDVVQSIGALAGAASTLKTILGEAEALSFESYLRDTARKVGETVGRAAGTVVGAAGDLAIGAAGGGFSALSSTPGGALAALVLAYIAYRAWIK